MKEKYKVINQIALRRDMFIKENQGLKENSEK